MPVPFATWLRATGLGWLLGIPAIVLLALAGEALGIGGVQVLVGLGMGIGVGLMQGRVVRPMLGRSWPWVCSSAVGLGLPFLVAAAVYLGTVASGGLLLGTMTGLVMRRLTQVR